MTLPPNNQQPNYYVAPEPMSPTDEKMWATLTHIGGLFLGFISPLIAFLVFGNRGPFIRAHAVTALNFHISLIIYSLGIVFIGLITLGIGSFLVLPFSILVLVFAIMAAVAANRGEFYKYPLAIEFVK